MVDGARLESVCTGNRTVGSNPTLSANKRARCAVVAPCPWRSAFPWRSCLKSLDVEVAARQPYVMMQR